MDYECLIFSLKRSKSLNQILQNDTAKLLFTNYTDEPVVPTDHQNILTIVLMPLNLYQ